VSRGSEQGKSGARFRPLSSSISVGSTRIFSKPTADKLPLDPTAVITTKGALSGAFCRLLSKIRENQRITLAMV
jgi:hypothetical protein